MSSCGGGGIVASDRSPSPRTLNNSAVSPLILPGFSVIATITIDVYWPTHATGRMERRSLLTMQRTVFTVRQGNITFAADVSEQNDPSFIV